MRKVVVGGILLVSIVGVAFMLNYSSKRQKPTENLENVREAAVDEGDSPIPIPIELTLHAQPGANTANLTIDTSFLVDLTNAKVSYFAPVELDLEINEKQQLGTPEILWEGNATEGLEKTFSRQVAIPSDTLLKVLVRVTGTYGPHQLLNEKPLFIAVKPHEVIAEDHVFFARRAELNYFVKQAGLSGASESQIVAQDPKLAWHLRHPSLRPEAETLYVQANDGQSVPYIHLPFFMLMQLPDSVRENYNAPEKALQQYYNNQVMQIEGLTQEEDAPIVFPKGMTFLDLPDSLRYLEDNPSWATQQRIDARRAINAQIRAWIQAQTSN